MKKLFAIAIVLAGCNPVHRIQRNQQQFEAIGRAWVAQHPRPADTVRLTTTTTLLHTDTVTTQVPVVLPGSTDTLWVRQQVVHHHYRDSVKLLVQDNTRADAAEKTAQAALNDAARYEATAQLLKKQLLWAVALAALLLLLLAAGVLRRTPK